MASVVDDIITQAPQKLVSNIISVAFYYLRYYKHGLHGLRKQIAEGH